MKKIISFGLLLAMLFSAVSCGLVTDVEVESSESVSEIEDNDPSEGTPDGEESESDENDDMNSELNMENFIKNATVYKAGSVYALVNGERVATFDQAEPPISVEGKIYFSSDFLLDNMDIFADPSQKIEKDGISYSSAEVFTDYDYFLFTDETYEIAVISTESFTFEDENAKKEFAKFAVNYFALGDGNVSALFKSDRPVLFTTDEMLEAAKAQATDQNDPLYNTMSDILKKADAALVKGPAPDTGKSAQAYRLAACIDMINAHYLAIAFNYTEDEKYLQGAVDFLLAYAGPMLGTDRYLDYSKPTTDGQADIGLNIAAPLTTACEVYALIYRNVSDNDKKTIERWIGNEAKLIVKGHEYWIAKEYYDEQYGNNHLSSHLMGIVAAALVLQDQDLLDYALLPEENAACLPTMIGHAILMEGDEVWHGDTDSDFRNGEIYDRYRVVSTPSNGFGYSMYHLKFLTHISMMLYNNGVDYFSYFGDNGENMKLSFLVYADYLIANDSTLHGGHYSGNSLNRQNAYSTYTIANFVYHDDGIAEVLQAFEDQHIQCEEAELFGISTLYLFGK